jgi:hypothetical protein
MKNFIFRCNCAYLCICLSTLPYLTSSSHQVPKEWPNLPPWTPPLYFQHFVLLFYIYFPIVLYCTRVLYYQVLLLFFHRYIVLDPSPDLTHHFSHILTSRFSCALTGEKFIKGPNILQWSPRGRVEGKSYCMSSIAIYYALLFHRCWRTSPLPIRRRRLYKRSATFTACRKAKSASRLKTWPLHTLPIA